MQNEKFIALENITATDFNNEEIVIEKGTILTGQTVYSQGRNNETWRFVDNDNNDFDVLRTDVKKSMENYLDYYQRSFSHLDKENFYFGQLVQGGNFTLENNGQKYYCEKIGDYQAKTGVTYNAVGHPIENGEIYWDMYGSKARTNQKHFALSADTVIDTSDYYKQNTLFLPGEPLKVSEYFVGFPQMLEVFDCLITKQPLSPEQSEVLKSFNEYTQEEESFWNTPKDISILEVNKLLAEEKRKEERLEEQRKYWSIR